MNLEPLFTVARPKIDELVAEARAQRRAMAVIVDELLGKAHIVSRGREDASSIVMGDERLELAARRRVAAQLASAPLEHMPVVLVSGTATSATADVKTVRRTFVEPGFDIEEAKKAGLFLVETLRVSPDEKEREWLDR
ncbi:MAG TPA: hypothetical protein VLM85_01170 [Polyangiaceae bacterium]|nr:hypothetical protein [Polyangiaceae bacterium]